jgi:predicted unusual protein kinase regulating ubiquinone biosynthesis (AarF/ABC1/UbiB family)
MHKRKEGEEPPQNWVRSLKITQTAGSLFLAFLKKHLGFVSDGDVLAESLAGRLGEFKGPLMKVAQILATVPNVLPDSYMRAFLRLQSHAPPMGSLFVKRRMAQELGAQWRTFFSIFDEKSTFAASLGQVHYAEDLDSHPLALKLQYPRMEDVMTSDLKQLRLFCKLYETYAGALITHNIQKEIEDRLREELDYKREARHMDLFQQLLAPLSGVRVPRVIPKLSTSKLLAMTWCSGKPFLQCQEAPQQIRECIASRLFQAWWLPFYRAGMLHGDPHMGNYTISPHEDNTLNILDFGCVRIFEPLVVEGVIDLFKAIQNKQPLRTHEAYEKLGFQNLTPQLTDALTRWAMFLYGPLVEDRVRPIDWDFSGHLGKAVAVDVHQALRESGGVAPPRAFVLLDRAAVGIGSALIHLRVSLNWHRLFLNLAEGACAHHITQTQQELGVTAS